MNKSLIILATLVFSIGFTYNLTSVSDIATAKSNIAFIINHEAFVINPAFLHQTKFAISNQNIDTTGVHTKSHGLNYVVFNGLGIGEMHKKELPSKNIQVGLIGYGNKINKNFSWGITYQSLSIENNGLTNSSWSTLVGMSYYEQKNNLFLGLTLEHFFKDTNSPLDDDLPPTIALGLNLVPWNQVMWSNKLSFVRKEGESIKYSSGLSVMINEKFTLNLGINETNYSIGFDLPFNIGQKSFGAVRYAVEVPYNISEQMTYSLAYTWGK